MSLLPNLAEFSEFLANMAPAPDGHLTLRADKRPATLIEYHSRYRIDADQAARIDADKLLYDICSDVYDCHEEYGDGELTAPKTTMETSSLPAHLSAATLVPIDPENEASISLITHWSALYSDMTLFVLPLSIESLDITYSGAYGSRTSYDEIAALLHFNKTYESIVSAKKGVFLPSATIHKYTSLRDYSITTYKAPFHQSLETSLRFAPINSRRKLRNLAQDFIVYKTIALPYFPDMQLNDIISIANEESDAFTKFNHFLNQRLFTNMGANSIEDINSCIAEVEYELINLNIEMKKISKLRVVQKAEVATFFLSLAALVFSDIDAVRNIAGIVGSVNLLQLVRDYAKIEREDLAARKSDVYLPYLLRKERTKRVVT